MVFSRLSLTKDPILVGPRFPERGAISKRGGSMSKNGDGREDDSNQMLARRLAKEVGISETVARGLIKLIGTDWNSLVREARFLKDRH